MKRAACFGALCIGLTSPGCDDGGSSSTGDTTDAGGADTGTLDASTQETGTPDTGAVDAGAVDAGAVDTGAVDTGAVDAGAVDAGAVDTGAVDTGAVDTGAVDTGAVDTGAVDTGAVDTGAPDTGTEVVCSPATGSSSCSNSASIVRLVVRLGDGMADVIGNLEIRLRHYSAFGGGSGSTGGSYHADAQKIGVTVGASTSVQGQIDMCLGSEMWSEDYCEYNFWAFIDLNGNDTLDVGEPAGVELLFLSCVAAESYCEQLVLDCVDGISCVSFGAVASCSAPAPGSC